MGCLLFGGRGRLTSALHRGKVIELIGEANAGGAGLVRACGVIGICLRTLKRWRKDFLGDGDGVDRSKGSARLAVHRLSEEERQRIMLLCSQPEYEALPPGQIEPALTNRGCASVPRAAFTGCSMPTAKCSVGVRVGQGHQGNPAQCQGSWLQEPIRCGVGTSRVCLPPYAESGCTSTW